MKAYRVVLQVHEHYSKDFDAESAQEAVELARKDWEIAERWDDLDDVNWHIATVECAGCMEEYREVIQEPVQEPVCECEPEEETPCGS